MRKKDTEGMALFLNTMHNFFQIKNGVYKELQDYPAFDLSSPLHTCILHTTNHLPGA